MKKLMLLFAVVALIFLAACTAPSDDLPRAQPTVQDNVVETDSMKDNMDADVMDNDMDDMKDTMDDSMEETADAAEAAPVEETVTGTDMADASAVAIDTSASSFTFVGFGPGKSHDGTFDDWEGTMYFDADANLVGAEGIIQVASVNTGIGGLDSHLLRDDFFDAENHPKIMIKSTALVNRDGSDFMQADLTFLGTTQNIEFPVTIDGNSISTDFALNARSFGLENTGVDDEVQITFTMVSN